MSYAPANAVQSYLPTTIVIPNEFKDANPILTDYFKKIIAALNSKDIAQYNTQEIVTGQQYFTPNDNNRFRQTYRKVISFPALAAGANNQAHGLGALGAFTFTRIYVTAQNAATPLFVPLPQGGPNDAMIEVGAANVTVTVPAAYSGAGWSALVTLEYIKA
jgi:hypothetical protein